MATLSPEQQITAGRNPERAHFGNAPSLAVMRKTYGNNAPAMWLLPQLLDLITYTNSRASLTEQQAQFVAESIAQEYYYLKASELLLFFYRFKTGAYGHFFGAVDPIKIMEALRAFAKERCAAIAKHESELAEAERAEHAKTAISPQEYCRRHGLPEMDSVIDIINYNHTQTE